MLSTCTKKTLLRTSPTTKINQTTAQKKKLHDCANNLSRLLPTNPPTLPLAPPKKHAHLHNRPPPDNRPTTPRQPHTFSPHPSNHLHPTRNPQKPLPPQPQRNHDANPTTSKQEFDAPKATTKLFFIPLQRCLKHNARVKYQTTRTGKTTD